MRDHGLEQRVVTTIAFTHPVAGADELWHGFLAGSLRTSALILPLETQRRIRNCFDRLVRDYQDEDVLEGPGLREAGVRSKAGPGLSRQTVGPLSKPTRKRCRSGRPQHSAAGVTAPSQAARATGSGSRAP